MADLLTVLMECEVVMPVCYVFWKAGASVMIYSSLGMSLIKVVLCVLDVLDENSSSLVLWTTRPQIQISVLLGLSQVKDIQF